MVKAYTSGNGSLRVIMQSVPLAEKEDVARIRCIVEQAIAAGHIQQTSVWLKTQGDATAANEDIDTDTDTNADADTKADANAKKVGSNRVSKATKGKGRPKLHPKSEYTASKTKARAGKQGTKNKMGRAGAGPSHDDLAAAILGGNQKEP